MARPRRGLGQWHADSLDIVETTLDQWWDYPPLVAAMQGNITEHGAWEGEAPDFADEQALARLRILERQGRTQEYIHLAEAEGQTSLYVNMLARSGQVSKAVAEARQWTQSPTEILSLATVLVEQGERTAALDVAGHRARNDRGGQQTELARGTVTLAQGADHPLGAPPRKPPSSAATSWPITRWSSAWPGRNGRQSRPGCGADGAVDLLP